MIHKQYVCAYTIIFWFLKICKLTKKSIILTDL